MYKRQALHNLHALLLKKRGVERSDASGEGTGYSLTISKHYESVAQELKKAKEQDSATAQPSAPSMGTKEDEPKKRAFAYVFRLMDLSTKMYLAYGFEHEI